METILTSIQPVIKNSRSVKINAAAIKRFSQTVNASDLEGSELKDENWLQGLTQEERIAFVLLYNSTNFCYWGKPKWAITSLGQSYDGSAGMIQALHKAIAEGVPLLKADFLKTISRPDLAKILQGNIEIPLFDSRLRMLRELGSVVQKQYQGSFTACIDRADWEAEKIVLRLAKEMPGIFNDVADYHGQEVRFYKRAQLVPALLYDLGRFRLIPQTIAGFDALTAFADYKVPQLLRRFGILEYSQALAKKINNLDEILAGSDDEIEIRANTIWAIELATIEIRKRHPRATAAQVDGIFWFKGQKKAADTKPYHRTRTVWY